MTGLYSLYACVCPFCNHYKDIIFKKWNRNGRQVHIYNDCYRSGKLNEVKGDGRKRI